MVLVAQGSGRHGAVEGWTPGHVPVPFHFQPEAANRWKLL
jgi:hypothetical protein